LFKKLKKILIKIKIFKNIYKKNKKNQKNRAQSGGKKTMAAFNECKLIRVKYNRQQTTTRSQQSQQSAISGR